MSAGSTTNRNASGAVPESSTGSDMDPVVVKPGSDVDPSTAPDWKEHVAEYFNEDTTHGEALPTASHEAKVTPDER